MANISQIVKQIIFFFKFTIKQMQLIYFFIIQIFN